MDEVKINSEFIIQELERRQRMRDENKKSSNRTRFVFALIIMTLINYLIITLIGFAFKEKTDKNQPRSTETSLKDSTNVRKQLELINTEILKKQILGDSLQELLQMELIGRSHVSPIGISSGIPGQGPRAESLETIIKDNMRQIQFLRDSIDKIQTSLSIRP